MSLVTGSPTALRRSERLPWKRPKGLTPVLKRWRGDSRVADNIVFDSVLPAQGARMGALPERLEPGVAEALRGRGITELYAHQSEAFERAWRGENVVIATPTASGKSLCYNIPVLNEMAQNEQARALYLFPTKALSRDQEQGLRSLMSDAGLAHGAMTYDGDTPGDARRAARERGGVLLTNPDMLHTGILPHHASWARLFANLKYVVIDELHTYRGVFGSHLANVLRRLKRIAAFHGADPVFLFASATIGNPAEHAEAMISAPVSLIDSSGAPTGPKHVLLYNPPVVNEELGIRQSCVKSAVRLAAELARAGVSTIVFGQSRNNVEVMLKYLRDRLGPEGIPPEAIQGYRGGYLPEARRTIEGGLREGRVLVVVATNALELGIDIGALDAVVCAGYPGSVASLWQRFGRAGRRGDPSLAVLVTNSSPLNQFFVLQPEILVQGEIEHARMDPDNIEILIQHLKCSAFELPFESTDGFGDLLPEAIAEALQFLQEHRVVHGVEDAGGKTTYHWSTDSYPANHVSLRSVGWDNVVIIDVDTERTIAEMDWRSTHTMLHEQAIYQHAGDQFQVEKLDYDNHKAFVRRVSPDYYTDAMTHVNVAVIDVEEQERSALGGEFSFMGGLGEVSVSEKVVGYKKIKYNTHENVGYGDVRLPEMQMHTSSFWMTVPNALVEAQEVPRPGVIDALRGISHGMKTVAVVGLMVDPRDLGRTLGDQSDPNAPPSKRAGGGSGKFDPTVFLYDSTPGGVGLATRIYEDRESLLRGTLSLIERCACREGCPACIGPVIGSGREQDALSVEMERAREEAWEGNRKRLAIKILHELGVTAFD